MMKLHVITAVKPLPNGRLLLDFDDDTAIVDLSAMLAQGGVFAPLRDLERFATVRSPTKGTPSSGLSTARRSTSAPMRCG